MTLRFIVGRILRELIELAERQVGAGRDRDFPLGRMMSERRWRVTGRGRGLFVIEVDDGDVFRAATAAEVDRRPHRTSASRSKRGPAGALETARFTPTVHEMTILRVRLFGFRFTDVWRDRVDEGWLCQARPWAEARPESSSGHGLDAGDGELFGCPTWTAIGDWAADAGRCGAWASWSTTPGL